MAPGREVETKIFLQSQRSWEMGQWNGCSSVEDIISSLHISYFLKYERFPGTQAEKTAVYGQTSHADYDRMLAVMFVSSHGFDINLLEIDEFGGNGSILTVLAELLLLYSTP